MKEGLKSIAMGLFTIGLLVALMTWGIPAMAFTIHQGSFEMNKLGTGYPYTYKELQEQCPGGIYRNLKEYSEFWVYPSLGNNMLDKKEFYIISKRQATYPIGEPSWEKENPTYYYRMGEK